MVGKTAGKDRHFKTKNMKYKLTDETKELYDKTLYRIECIEAFSNVKAGDRGGWVEFEGNLSQFGNAWVFGDAVVSDNAEVRGDAVVSGKAEVSDNAVVRGDAVVSGKAEVSDNAVVSGKAVVSDNAEVRDNAWVFTTTLS